MDNKMKERKCVDKCRSKCKKKRSSFHGYKAENVTTTTTQSESMHMQDGELPILETINKIVPIAGNSNSSQGPGISDIVSHRMKRDVFQKVS